MDHPTLKHWVLPIFVCSALLVVFGRTLESAPSSTPPPETRANFRAPPRQYEHTSGEWDIYVETSLAAGDPALARAAREKLERSLREIFAVLPERPARVLRPIPFYLLWGEAAPGGGRDSGMSYIRAGEPQRYPYLDPKWNNVIVVYSAANLMYLDALWTKKSLTHEIAHAWHIRNWPDKYEPIYRAYQNANARGLYRNVTDYKGKVIADAYAIRRNQLEYFAELSAIYFVGSNYYPFDRAGLAKYDPVGERMVRTLWGP
jgi:hypothetical protein